MAYARQVEIFHEPTLFLKSARQAAALSTSARCVRLSPPQSKRTTIRSTIPKYTRYPGP